MRHDPGAMDTLTVVESSCVASGPTCSSSVLIRVLSVFCICSYPTLCQNLQSHTRNYMKRTHLTTNKQQRNAGEGNIVYVVVR